MNITDALRQRVQAHLDGPMSDDVYDSLLDGIATAAPLRAKYERTCPKCGTTFILGSNWMAQRFCSGCAVIGRPAAA